MPSFAVDPLGAVPDRSPECAALLTRTAERIEARVEEIALRLIDRVVAEMHLDPADVELHEDLLAAARGSVALITVNARSWTDPRIVPPPHDALTWSRSLVGRGLAIDALLRVYRIGQSGYMSVWFDELTAGDDDHAVVVEAMNAVTAFVFTWIDTISTPLVEAYEDERTRRLSGSVAVRTETVERILAGEAIDIPTASARLGYPLDRPHIALVAWAPRDEVDTVAGSLDERLAEVAGDIAPPDDRPTLIVRTGPQIAAGWVVGERVDPDALARVRASARAQGMSVALAVGGVGLAGFRRGHDHAQRARRVARLLRPGAALTHYDDVSVLDLLTRDPAAARELAASTLGALATDDDATRRLLATLRIFFEEGQSFARTARRVGVHENTVSYRIRRAVERSNAPGLESRALWVAVELAPLLVVQPQDPDG